MKSLFIRCSEETYELAHALAKKESRSLNKQIIHMIHNEADSKGVSVDKKVEPKMEETVQIRTGLSGIVGTKTQGFVD